MKALQLTAIEDVWGVGRKTFVKLAAGGVKTAYDFAQWGVTRVRNSFHKLGEQMWRELNGEHILDLETAAARQSLQHTRTFKQPITDAETLHSLMVDFARTFCSLATQCLCGYRSLLHDPALCFSQHISSL